MRVFALRPYQPCAHRVYQPATLPERRRRHLTPREGDVRGHDMRRPRTRHRWLATARRSRQGGAVARHEGGPHDDPRRDRPRHGHRDRVARHRWRGVRHPHPAGKRHFRGARGCLARGRAARFRPGLGIRPVGPQNVRRRVCRSDDGVHRPSAAQSPGRDRAAARASSPASPCRARHACGRRCSRPRTREALGAGGPHA
jgi:hypothetical protein